MLPTPIFTIVAGYLGPESCYIYNLVVPHNGWGTVSKGQKYQNIIIYVIRTRWMDALVLLYDEKLMPINSVLEHAARNNYIPAMKFAVSRGANDWNGALRNAASFGHVLAINYLESCCNVDWGFTLYYAQLSGNAYAIEYVESRTVEEWNDVDTESYDSERYCA